MAMQIRGIKNDDDGVGAAELGIGAGEDIGGNAFVVGTGVEAVDAGEIDDKDIAALLRAGAADVVFDGNAGEVGDLLAEAGEPVEERCLAGVRRPD
jgi:hypothetical protein